MSLHVVVGAGPVGSATARLLSERGDRVRVITRRGAGPQHPGIERVAVDAADTAAFRQAAAGATVIYNCAAPPYWRWTTDFPPLWASLLDAAEATGAVLASTGNLYGYAPATDPLTEDLPLEPTTVKGRVRARMWMEALKRHRAGRIRAIEARASDFVGAGALTWLSETVIKPVAAGRRASVPADLDAPHTWTYVGDVARTLVTLAEEQRAWGAPWHVPSDAPASVREIAARVSALTGSPPPRLSVMPGAVLRAVGLLAPIAGPPAKLVRELRELTHQRDRPWLVDSSAATAAFGLKPTPLEEALRETVSA
ncbi:NAD-dependent epimerase/dehydratase family protein [Nonomuraea jiangxiensis]|uniref:Nucleoside-diphosphate-sugar epimerase n=1 Tax=Nonomuraea jiangxiensis TaxID=633440 RepID=A0A1G9PIP6_9ACTN|nr:NAD-dependent epimerase/dehydratase family protein [Nonomuraea jiangxiensis]SDL98584.1 Nucleoside-diphosphate-sugar epimerase [Nonomuraea jiangxiensis]